MKAYSIYLTDGYYSHSPVISICKLQRRSRGSPQIVPTDTRQLSKNRVEKLRNRQYALRHLHYSAKLSSERTTEVGGETPNCRLEILSSSNHPAPRELTSDQRAASHPLAGFSLSGSADNTGYRTSLPPTAHLVLIHTIVTFPINFCHFE